MPQVSGSDVARMRDQLFFEGPDQARRLSRFWLLLGLAAVIASAGVVGDSTATVIGAMIVAPLMVPILGCVLAIAVADHDNLARCVALIVTGAIAVVAIGYLVGLATTVPIVAATNSQVAARVSPRVIDLIAALATGAVGAVALARDDISDTLPGVAIAISLVPPLAVVGLTLESGASDESFGALLLFITNVSAILAMGLLVMALYRVRLHGRATDDGTRPVNRRRATTAVVVGLVVISVPLAATSVRIASTEADQIKVSDAADEWAGRVGWEIVSVAPTATGFDIRAAGPLPAPDPTSLTTTLEADGLGDTDVVLELIPSTKVTVSGGDARKDVG